MATRPIGAYRGTVTRLDGPHVWVHVPHLNDSPGHAYGPLQILEFPGLPGLATTTVDAHSHGLSANVLAVGNRVLVQPIDGRPDDLIVLGRIPT
jgi:hypothetical protein